MSVCRGKSWSAMARRPNERKPDLPTQAVCGRPTGAMTTGIYGGVPYGLRSVYKPLNRQEDDAEERATSLLLDYVATWYAVHRRDALLKAFTDMVDRTISDVALMELLVAAELAALGKQKTDSSCASYLRQLNSSQDTASSGSLFVASPSKLVKSEIVAMAQSLAALIGGRTDETALVSRMHAAILGYRESRMTAPVTLALRFYRFVGRYLHTFQAKIPAARAVFAAIEKRRLFAGLRSHGATRESIAVLRCELDLVWSAVGYRIKDLPAKVALRGNESL